MTTPITPAIDVNEAFRNERISQIGNMRDAAAAAVERSAKQQADFDQRVKDGKMVDLGNGAYRVTDPGSWDNGEVWTVRNVNGQNLVLPQDNLDKSTGQAALYSRVPAWHALGNIVPEGVADIDSVLKLGGIDFNVSLRPVQFTAANGALITMPGKFATVRDDLHRGLGVVGDRYQPIQNRQPFEFLEELVEHYDLLWDSAGALYDGKRVFVAVRLPEDVTIDAEGVNDKIRPYIVVINSHDGNSEMRVVVTPWLPVCGNTERFAVRDALTRWGIRHMGNPVQRMKEARRSLGLSLKYYEQFAIEETKLAQTDLAIAEFRKVCDEVWPLEPDEDGKISKRSETIRDKRQADLDDLFTKSPTTERARGTAYAAERAITEYSDWLAAVRPSGAGGKLRDGGIVRATRQLAGSDDKRKSKAHEKLMLRVR